MFGRLHRQPEVGSGAEQGASLADPEVGLTHMRAIGTDRINQMHPVVHDQRDAGPVQHLHELSAECHQLVIGRVVVPKLHDAHPGADCRRNCRREAELLAHACVGHQVERQIQRRSASHLS
jgi:hypothetical protein